jgi:hypothetical protein
VGPPLITGGKVPITYLYVGPSTNVQFTLYDSRNTQVLKTDPILTGISASFTPDAKHLPVKRLSVA